MNTAQFTVSTSPVLVFSGTGRVKIRNVTGVLFIGDSSVSSTTGFGVVGTESFEFSCPTDVYAISNASASVVHVSHNH